MKTVWKKLCDFEKFVDCVYEYPNLREKIAYGSYMPTTSILHLASIVIFETKEGMFLVKERNGALKEDGTIDIEEVHKNVRNAEYLVIDKATFSFANDYKEIEIWIRNMSNNVRSTGRDFNLIYITY